jgi:integrase/recombinase XerD
VKEDRTTPLRERMIEDMRIRGMGEKTEKAHIRGVKDLAAFSSGDRRTPRRRRSCGPTGCT